MIATHTHRLPDYNDEPADDYEAALASSEPIPTDFGDIEDGDRSTQAGAIFAVALVMAIAAACFGLWLAGQKGLLS